MSPRNRTFASVYEGALRTGRIRESHRSGDGISQIDWRRGGMYPPYTRLWLRRLTSSGLGQMVCWLGEQWSAAWMPRNSASRCLLNLSPEIMWWWVSGPATKCRFALRKTPSQSCREIPTLQTKRNKRMRLHLLFSTRPLMGPDSSPVLCQ